MKHYIAFLLYLGSISIAVVAAHSFVVMGLAEVLLLIACVLTGPLLVVSQIFKESERLAIAAIHIAVAALIHPAVTFGDRRVMSTEEQVTLLAEVNRRTTSTEWWIRADLARDLATSLKDDTNRRLKFASPAMYWVFPPSAALFIWAILLYLLLPPGGSASRPKGDQSTAA